MKKLRRGKRFAMIMLLFVMAGSLLNFRMVQATEAGDTTASSGESQSGEVTKNSNVKKKVTKKNTDVLMETFCGIDGFAAYDNPVPISITVTYNKDFTGSIRMIPVMENGKKVAAYGEDISLAKGEAKTFSFTPSALGSNGKIEIELLDENEKVIYAETDTVSLNSIGTNVVMGILSDDYSGLNYFDGVPAVFNGYQGVVNTLKLTNTSFPEGKDALSILNYILIDNYDTANLSDEQYEALKGWVSDGGVLILSLGSNYQNVLHKFSDEFVSGTLGNLNKKQITWEIEGQELSLDDVDSMEFVLDGGTELENFSVEKTAYKKEIGLGAVVVLSYDLGMEPMASYKNRKAVATYLISESSVLEVVNKLTGNVYFTNGVYSGSNIAKMMNNMKKPSALIYGLILVIYIVLAGPILYLILKNKGKREKMWIAIPLVSLLFTIIIYATGFIYRVDKPIIDTFSVISIDNNGKAESVYMNITCPKAKQYRFSLNDEYKNIKYDIENFSYSILETTEQNSDAFDFMIKKKNGGTELITNNESTFDETSFLVSKTGENDMGTLDMSLHFYTDGFDGTVTNNTNYDLENVVVNFENRYYRAGNLKKGETVTLDKTKIIEGYSYETFDYLYRSDPKLYRDSNLYKNYQIDNFMEMTYVDSSAYKQGCIWARIGEHKPEVIDKKSGKTSGEAVIFMTFSGDYEDISGEYCPDISKLMMSSDGDYDQSDGMIYSNSITLTYSLEDCNTITELINQSYNKTPTNYAQASYADVYAYNPSNGAYEQIFKGSDTLSGIALKKYIVNDILILKFERGATSTDTVFMPKIAAKEGK